MNERSGVGDRVGVSRDSLDETCMRKEGKAMNENLRRSVIRFCAAIVFVGLAPWMTGAATGLVPLKALLTDSPGDKILSDGFGFYTDEIDCVKAYIGGSGKSSGFAFMRTGQHVDHCPTPSQPRELVLDFSDPVPGSEPVDCQVEDPAHAGLFLDACGLNSVPDGRIISGHPFKSTNPTTAGATVSFNIVRPPTFPNIGVSFELKFEQPLPVTGAPGDSRTITAGGTAIAELYKYVRNRNKVTTVSIGRYYMPFQVTYTKLP